MKVQSSHPLWTSVLWASVAIAAAAIGSSALTMRAEWTPLESTPPPEMPPSTAEALSTQLVRAHPSEPGESTHCALAYSLSAPWTDLIDHEIAVDDDVLESEWAGTALRGARARDRRRDWGIGGRLTLRSAREH